MLSPSRRGFQALPPELWRYLAREESSYMNGQTLHLNGGVILNT